MKKFGFTLAEILVTLGIIGVVAALTLPNLKINTTNAKIGPALGKAVSTFELANEMMLEDNGWESISQAGFANSAAYIDKLLDYVKGDSVANITSVYDGKTYSALRTKDGFMFLVDLQSPFPDQPGGRTFGKPHKNVDGVVQIDINGTADPNAVGEDHFVFGLFDDGSLRPKGHPDWMGGNGTDWSNTCKADESPTDPSDCTAHIFDNGLKVLYK